MARITLVDDDENIVTSVSLALESQGHAVKAYFDGASGLAALENDPPDLAILDVKMPRMDGMEVLRRLRRASDLPVIILTSKDDEIDRLLDKIVRSSLQCLLCRRDIAMRSHHDRFGVWLLDAREAEDIETGGLRFHDEIGDDYIKVSMQQLVACRGQ